MPRMKAALIVGLMTLATVAWGQNEGTAPNQGAGQAGNAAAQQHVLRVIAPRPGEKLRQNYVTVQIALMNAAASAAGLPNYQIRLDNRDPVTTNSAEYTFTGVAPGEHTVEVQLVDANQTPVAGAHAVVTFVTVQPSPTSSFGRPHGALMQAAMRIQADDDANPDDTDRDLPSAGGALPLLSVIGFGVLLGGIASAMRTR